MTMNINVAAGQVALMKFKEFLGRKLREILVHRLPSLGYTSLTTDVKGIVVGSDFEVAAVNRIALGRDGNINTGNGAETLMQKGIAIGSRVKLTVYGRKLPGLLLLQRSKD